MPIQVPSIREFPDDNRIWRLDWLGAVEQRPSEVLINVYLSPAKEGIARPRVQADFEQPGIKVRIGVGQLPFLVNGSLWRNRQRLPEAIGERVLLPDIRIDSTTVKLVDTGTHVAENRWLIPPFVHTLEKSVYPSRCLAIHYRDDPHGILLPVIEAIRFYYAVSTDLAHVVFSGAFRLDRDSLVNESDGNGMLVGAKRMVLRLRQWLADDDGWIIGRVLDDPHAEAGVMRVYDSLLRNMANSNVAFPECGLPFEGSTDWIARGVSYKNESGNKRWLIHELEHCSAPFPFELEIVRDNDGRKVADPDEDLPPGEKRPAWAGRAKTTKPRPTSEMQSEDAPDVDVSSISIPLASERFGDLIGKEIIKTPKEQCKYKSASFQKPRGSDVLGTGKGTHMPTGIGGAKVTWAKSDIERRKSLPASFDAMLQIVDALKTMEGVSAGLRPSAPEIEFVALSKPPRHPQWGYLDFDAETLRRVLVADVTVSETHACLIEFEQRASERYKAALLISNDSAAPSNRQLAYLLRQISVAQGVWSKLESETEGVRLMLFKHTRPSAAAFAKAIYAAMLG